MDVFFFITSVFVVILIIILAISSYYIYQILSTAKKISEKASQLMDEAKEEGSAVIASFASIRKKAEATVNDGKGAKSLVMLVAAGIVAKVAEVFIKNKVFKK